MTTLRPSAAGLWRPGRSPAPGEGSIAEFVALSALVLFWEVCLIRWVSTEIRVFAYYKNLPLLAAFLGFGAGLLGARRGDSWIVSALGSLAALACVVVLYPISPLRIDEAPAFFEEFTWHKPLASAGVAIKFYAVIAGIFALLTIAFVPLGRRLAWFFERLEPIPAYSLNVAASLLGLGVFSIVSLAGAPPLAWTAIGIAPFVAIAARSGAKGAGRRAIAVVLALVPLVVTGGQWLRERTSTSWSPYYKVEVLPPKSPPTFAPCATLNVNHDYHQHVLDLRPEFVAAQEPLYKEWALSYELPYVVGTTDRVLVVGAGTGNDVAAALRHGASRVTAVEIDPTIWRIGRDIHPERPYASSRVDVRIEDARTFLSHARVREPFDRIVFGLLDSHTQVSGMNSLRLDNFVYTVESLRRARALLDPDRGVLSLSFSAAWGTSNWTVRRLARMLREAFGEEPHALATGYDAGVTFLAGPATREHPFFRSALAASLGRQAAAFLAPERQGLEEPPATDDWPFLYLRHRALPVEYWILIAVVVATAALFLKRATGSALPREPHFFLLGAAFLLVEVKNLVELSLLFGSTWQVNTLAIGAILAMILLSNLVAHRQPALRPGVLYALLLAVLVAGCFVRPTDFERWAPGWQRVIVPLWLSVPIFLAGLVFIRSFARAADPSIALGANVLGGIAGALVEYSSLALGIHVLQYLAIALYAASWIALALRRPKQVPAVAVGPANRIAAAATR